MSVLPPALPLQIANVLTSVILSSGLAFAYLLAYGLPHLASYLPAALYCSLLALLLFPGPLLERDSRLFFGRTLWRIVTPLRSVTWADFLLADVLTRWAAAFSGVVQLGCSKCLGPCCQLWKPQGWVTRQPRAHSCRCCSPALPGPPAAAWPRH